MGVAPVAINARGDLTALLAQNPTDRLDRMPLGALRPGIPVDPNRTKNYAVDEA